MTGPTALTVLIADDDPQMLRALRVTLTARGYTVVTAANGAAAVNGAIAHKPDLIMLDLGMPELDGIDVIHAVRGWSSVPILVVSVARERRTRSRPSTPERTTTSPSRSSSTRCSRASVPSRAAFQPATRRAGGDGRRNRRFGDQEHRPRHRVGTRLRSASRPPSGKCSRCCCATPARLSRGRPCSRRSGAPNTLPTRGTCGSTWRSCARSSRRCQASLDIC